jgi:hypothetical protein
MGTALTSEAAGGRKLANSKSSSHLLPTSSVALAVRSDRAFITHSRITWRQKVGATPIEAQKAAGHASLDMTFLYTQTDEAREREHVRRILERLKPMRHLLGGFAHPRC